MPDGGHDRTGLLKQALEHIDGDEAWMIEAFGRTISVDTSFPPGRNYAELANVLDGMIGPMGFASHRVLVPEALWRTPGGPADGERVNLVARRRTGRPVCAVYFHVDTVPPGDGWSMDPFRLTRRGDRLHGRGAADMKGTIVSVLAAIRAADAAGLPLMFDVDLLFCTDEEGGLYPGIRYLAEKGEIEGHLLSFNGQAAPRIWGGCFGSIDLEIRIHGRTAHSGDPVGGVNALAAALPVMQALQTLGGALRERASAMTPPPHFPPGEPLRPRLTLAAAHAGDKGSALPGLCRLVVNRRYMPEEDAAEVIAEVERTVAEAVAETDALDWSVTVIGHLAPVSDPTGPHWPRWQAALSQGFGWPRESFREYGSGTSSDMGWVQQAGIREILLGGLTRPDNGAHAADEYTTLTDLKALARSVLLYLADHPLDRADA
ncbi:MAG: M20/M25/M40 family metallo-hydrolase [Azospirillaceae bacterium]